MTDDNQTAQPEQPNGNSAYLHASQEDKTPQQLANPGGIPPEHRLMTTKEVADYFQVTGRTVEAWRTQRLLPYRKIGRTIRYKLADVLQALDDRFLIKRKL